MHLIKAIIISIMILIIASSCSGGNKTPVANDLSTPDSPEMLSTAIENTNRHVLAVYDAAIDPVSKTLTVTPSERIADYHFPLTQLYPNVLKIVGYGWTPNFWADIKLTHPFPGSGIDAFDPRVIAILPANPGVSFNYPVFNCIGNNKVVLEPDGYTKLFDNLGGSIPGNTNPFKAYFKDQPYRVWSSTGATSETQRWNLNLAGFGGPMQYKLVVDVSTNYPDIPEPVIDNAREPVQIDVVIGQGLTPDGGSADITVTLLDWQGRMSVGGVSIEAPVLFSDVVSLSYSKPGPNPNEYVYIGIISNDNLAPAGEYKVLVAAWDQTTDIYIYNEFVAIVRYTGNLIWAKRAGGPSYDGVGGITHLSDDSTVVTGYFSGSATFGQGEQNETILNSVSPYVDLFITRYNQDGMLAWAKSAGGTGTDSGQGITTLSDNATVMTGYFEGSATFGLGEPNQITLISTGNADIFISRYNSDGTIEWAKRAGGTDDEIGFGITTLSDNSTVVTGYFKGSAIFGPNEPNEKVLWSAGNHDIFIAKYNPDGTLGWAKRAGGTGGDVGGGITTLSDNSTVITGSFTGSATFGQYQPNETVLTSVGQSDFFIAQYNPDGTLAWAKRAGGPSYDGGGGITPLSDDSTVVTGYFNGLATFGPDEPNETILSSAGNWDIFMARYNPDGTLVWAKRAGGSRQDRGNEITTLSDNSTVVTGCYRDLAIFGPGELNETILTSAGYYDIFIARYNPDGKLAWAKSAGGSGGGGEGNGITTLSDNSTVVTGYFYVLAIFGPGELNETILNSVGDPDIFIARFDP